MPTQSPSFNWGSEIKNVNSTLYNQLNDSYSSTAKVVNTKISKYTTTTDPKADDPINSSFQDLDIWGNSTTNSAWILTSRTSNTAVTWTKIT